MELLMATINNDHDDELPAEDGWEDDEEMEDFTRLPYPPEWDEDDPDSRKAYHRKVLADFQTTMAAALWNRAVELVEMQGYMPDEATAEIMRRCTKVSRRTRQAQERFEQEEAEYAVLAADPSLCEWPWGRLCPEHGIPLVATRSGTRCRVEGCERRWSRGFHSGHCDLPAAVIIHTEMKSSGQWRLCAGHRRMFPKTELIRVLRSPTGEAGPDPAEMIEWPESGA
jgi:hypothetical protein